LHFTLASFRFKVSAAIIAGVLASFRFKASAAIFSGVLSDWKKMK